jgi:hypothetical protein
MQCEYFILLNSTGIYLLEKGGGEILQGAKMKYTSELNEMETM